MICNKIRKPLSLVFSFIVTFMAVTCQIMPCMVFAEALPDPSLIEVPLWTVIEGGSDEVVEQIVKPPFLFSSEIDSMFALNAVAKEHYWNETKATINQKIADGTLSSSDIGTVLYYEIDGQRVPVGIKHSILYGDSMFFLTDDLAYKIQSEQLQSEQAILDAVEDYWTRVIVSDIEPFQNAVASLNNWVTSVHASTSSVVQKIVNETLWNAFGISQSTPLASFYETGEYGTARFQGRNYVQSIPVNSISNYTDFIVIKYECSYPAYLVQYIRFYAHSVNDVDPHIYRSIAGTWGRASDYGGFIATEGIKEITLSQARAESLGLTFSGAAPIDITDLFPNWDLIVSLPDVAPSIQPGIRYNVGAIEGAVDDIAELAQSAIDANSDSQGNPEYNPGDYPVIDPDELPDVLPAAYPLPLPVEFPQDFPDPDPWIDSESNPFPDPVPDSGGDGPGGDGPGGDDSGGDDPGGDDPGGDEPPLPPELILPVLGGLFPFCIPQDVYNTIRVFNSTADEPIWDIPLNLSVGSRQLTNTNLHIDLTQNGLDTFFSVLRAVQIIVFIIGLAVFTKQFIF